MKKRFVFVTGTPRSGTSIAARALKCHAKIAMGTERYNKLWVRDEVFPEHFEQDRFYDFQLGDTGRIEEKLEMMRPYQSHFASAEIVGDKYPYLWRHYDTVFSRFDPVQVVYIVRDPVSVCLSHKRRFEDPDDRFTIDWKRGLHNWNMSLRKTLERVESGYPIIVCNYQSLFKSIENVSVLFGRLGLSIKDADHQKLEEDMTIFRSRNDVPRSVPSDMLETISRDASFGVYRKILTEHCIFADQATDVASQGIDRERVARRQ